MEKENFSCRKAAAYVRVSTEDQTEFSPASQIKKIKEYAKAHQLLIPEEYVFTDEGISGRTAGKRPEFMKMISVARQTPKPFDMILVWKFSRFARNRQDSILYKSMLRKECGIDVISITEQLSKDPTSILIEALLEAMDEYYSLNLAQEVKRGMYEKFSRGGVVSVPPFGYRMGRDGFLIDEENALVVKKIYREFLEGNSCGQIARELNRLGVCTARGNPFQSRSVSYILQNPVYTGKLRRRTEKKDGYLLTRGSHKPIIEEAVFQKVQKEMTRSVPSFKEDRGGRGAGYLWKGIVCCSCCGGLLTQLVKGKALQCSRYAKGTCKESHYVSLPLLEKAVFSKMQEDFQGCGKELQKLLSCLENKEEQGNYPEKQNRLLRLMLAGIVFDRKKGTVQLFYRE